MITALYASLLMLLIIWLTFEVIKQRRNGQVAYADGGVKALQIARSAHGNAIETIPISLILMLLLEFNEGSIYLIHIAGLMLVVGRILHGTGILKENMTKRKFGMIMTLLSQVTLVICNFIYIPYGQLIS